MPTIVGAYTSVDGTSPMFAATAAAGGRASRRRPRLARLHARRARGRARRPSNELRALKAMLEASLAAEEGRGPGDLGRAIGAHREGRERRVEREAAADVEGRPARPRQTSAGRRPPTRTARTSCVAARPGCVFRRLDATRPQSRRSSLARSRRAPANLTTRRFPTPEPIEAERRVDAEAERGDCVPASAVR